MQLAQALSQLLHIRHMPETPPVSIVAIRGWQNPRGSVVGNETIQKQSTCCQRSGLRQGGTTGSSSVAFFELMIDWEIGLWVIPVDCVTVPSHYPRYSHRLMRISTRFRLLIEDVVFGFFVTLKIIWQNEITYLSECEWKSKHISNGLSREINFGFYSVRLSFRGDFFSNETKNL